MKTNKVIRIEDHYTFHYIFTYTSKELIELDELLGDVKTFLDVDLFKAGPEYCFKKSLFPKSRVQPINLDNITKNTVVILGLRPKHYLINTTFSPDYFFKDVIFDTNRDKLNYIFHNFKDTTLAIKPRIAEDNIGLLKYFGDNLENNQIRNAILYLMNYPKSPNDTLNNLFLSTADYSIRYDSHRFWIKCNGLIEIPLEDSSSVRDLIYVIHNKVNTDRILDFWKRFHVRKSEVATDGDALENMIRNHNRLLENIVEIENELKINAPNKFSNFIKSYIDLSTSTKSISYKAPDSIKWFSILPKEFNQS